MGKITYTDEIDPYFGIPFDYDRFRIDRGELKLNLSPERIASMSDAELQTVYDILEKQPEAAIQDPVTAGWTLPSWNRIMESWGDTKIIVIWAGNRCITGDSLILDAETGEHRRIDSIKTEHKVWARHGEVAVIAHASKPFCKGRMPALQIELGNGEVFTCSHEHRVLAFDINFSPIWIHAKDLKTGYMLPTVEKFGYYRTWITKHTPVISIKDAGEHQMWDMSVPLYKNYYSLGCFHHNSGKSFFAHRASVHAARTIPDAKIYMWHVNEERSVVDTQRGVWDSLPMAYKQQNKKKGQNFSLNYSQKNGFSGSTCILPSSDPDVVEGSSIFFKYYTQYLADSQVAEGWNAHLIHLDEEAPLKLFETMIPRLTDFHGRLILTFTTLKGWTPLINELLRGAETTKTRYSELLNMDLPIEQTCKTWDSCKIFYWWTEDNPFIDSHELVKMYRNRPLEDKLARLYGVPTNSQYGRFPGFKRNVNVIAHDDLPFIKDPTVKVTRYFVTDPGGTKPWVAAWFAVTQEGLVYVYRETPTDEWAIPHTNASGRPIGKPGRGQKPNGWGFDQWYEHFTELEGEEEIEIRVCDPGFGTQKITIGDGQTDIFAEMSERGFDMIPCYRGEVEPGVAKINDLLAWDDTQPLSYHNRPKFYISDQCENMITAMQEFSNCGKDEHFKDFIDLIRYFIETGAMYVDEKDWEATASGGY